MKTRTLLITFAMFMILALEITGQNSQTLYHMNLPQAHLLNPAFKPAGKFYIGFPGITDVNINVTNNFLNFSDVFLTGLQPNDSVISFLYSDFDVDSFIDKLGRYNSVEPRAAVQLLGIGFSAGKDFYGYIDITEKIDGSLVFPRELFELAFRGNDAFIGSAVDLSSFDMEMKYYRDVSLGFSKNITPKLRIGVQGKMLFGIASMSMDTKTLKVMAAADDVHNVETDVTLNVSGPVRFIADEENHVDDLESFDDRFDSPREAMRALSGTKNMGLGINLGAEYQVTDKIAVSASVTDLGYIKWKSDLTGLYSKGTVEFSNYNIEDVYNGEITFEEFGESLADTLSNALMVSDDMKPFTTTLPFGVTFAGKYDVSDKFSVGLVSYSRVRGKQIKEALTLSGNLNLGNMFSTSLSYTACNYSYNNIGAGLALRLGFFQFYVIADRIPLKWSEVEKTTGSYRLPDNWNTFNARFGFNLTFGNRIKKGGDTEILPEGEN